MTTQADGTVIRCPHCQKANRVRPVADGIPRCANCHQPLPWVVSAAQEGFDAEIAASVPVLVDFWAPWCGPCRTISPIVERLANRYAGQMKLVKVNIDEHPGLAARYGAMSIPLLVVFQDRHEVARQVGAVPEARLAGWLEPFVSAERTGQAALGAETAHPRQIWTVGHWTCPEQAFLRPLHAHAIDLLVDVRAQPGSRRNPHFGREAMPQWLADAGIEYVHLPELGGRRPRQDVDPGINAGWRQPSFKNYADYTLSPDYRHGIQRLAHLTEARHAVIMCGEPMPWRCHRLLIANTLTAGGWSVWHLIGDAAPRQHELGRWGATPSVDANAQVTYPPTA